MQVREHILRTKTVSAAVNITTYCYKITEHSISKYPSLYFSLVWRCTSIFVWSRTYNIDPTWNRNYVGSQVIGSAATTRKPGSGEIRASHNLQNLSWRRISAPHLSRGAEVVVRCRDCEYCVATAKWYHTLLILIYFNYGTKATLPDTDSLIHWVRQLKSLQCSLHCTSFRTKEVHIWLPCLLLLWQRC
jgi:hypothetical protein